MTSIYLCIYEWEKEAHLYMHSIEKLRIQRWKFIIRIFVCMWLLFFRFCSFVCFDRRLERDFHLSLSRARTYGRQEACMPDYIHWRRDIRYRKFMAYWMWFGPRCLPYSYTFFHVLIYFWQNRRIMNAVGIAVLRMDCVPKFVANKTIINIVPKT